MISKPRLPDLGLLLTIDEVQDRSRKQGHAHVTFYDPQPFVLLA